MENIKCLNINEENNVDDINIVYITDINYFANTCISIYSIKKNKSTQLKYHIYVVLDKVPEKEAKILYSLDSEEFQLHLLEATFDLSMFNRVDFPVSSSACHKFRLAEILNGLDKVIYLDGDTIVQSDLQELFNTDIEDGYAAVVRDIIAENFIPSQMDKLNFSHEYYFNSGVMLLNLRKIREDGMMDKLMDYRLNGINYFMDQDALNVVFADKVRYLPARFNYLITLSDYADNISFPDNYEYRPNDLEWERIHSADIVHLTGKKKPWKEYVPYATELFMSFYVNSPFRREFSFLLDKNKGASGVISEKYLFPYEVIPKNAQIVIWGAGKVGQEFYRQVRATGFCRVVGVIDECADQYNHDENTWKGLFQISTPEKLKDLEYDYVVIAVKREQIAKDIINRIERINPELDEKLIWKYPVYI